MKICSIIKFVVQHLMFGTQIETKKVEALKIGLLRHDNFFSNCNHLFTLQKKEDEMSSTKRYMNPKR
jgi:hypothetical protein